jgi:polyphenol oxidase
MASNTMSTTTTPQKRWEQVVVGPSPRVSALFTLRGEPAADASRKPCYRGLNLGLHVGDEASAVTRNRQTLAQATVARPVFMKQVHGTHVVRLHPHSAIHGFHDSIEADGAFTTEPGVACVVMVADCLPVLMADDQGRFVAAAHAGWRGLAAGVIDATLEAACEATKVSASRVHAWLGPCIGPAAFEVGRDVLNAFEGSASMQARGSMANAFSPSPTASRHPDGAPRWLADLPQLAQQRLRSLGVNQIFVHAGCTFSDPARYFSYRRDGATGRHAAMIWLEESAQPGKGEP